MTDSHYDQLRDLGYLSSPVARVTWRMWSPENRGSLKVFLLAWLLWGGAVSALLGSCALAAPSLQIKIALTYWLISLPLLAGLVALQNLMLTARFMRGLLIERGGLNYWDFLWALAWLAGFVLWLSDALHGKRVLSQWLLGSSLVFLAYLGGQWLKILAIHRLYWYGLKPPQLKHHPYLMVSGLIGLGLFFGWHRTQPDYAPTRMPPPLIALAFDVPNPNQVETPDGWSEFDFETESSDISQAWVTLGTGVGLAQHRASLFGYQLGPLTPLTDQDAVQKPLIMLGRWLGWAKKNPGGGRFRPYAWEIMDWAGISTLALGYWNSFPASAAQGMRMSERWQGESQMPYATGLPPLNRQTEPLAIEGDPAVQVVLTREQAQWLYLAQLLKNPPAFTIAYFPLADILNQRSDQQGLQLLQNYRSKQLLDLLGSLSQDVRLCLIFSSGRAHPDVCQWRIVCSPQAVHELGPIQNLHDFAPQFLGYFGLPLDRDMQAPPTYNGPKQRLEYRRNPSLITASALEDAAYLEQLRSLGYIH
ncbi:MAG: hypothetical protein KDC71_10910 [Acidobacteria bacterium]|nr:hypothetical protein [Acidobacteriota bacterium]